jgi:hypothetical protein
MSLMETFSVINLWAVLVAGLVHTVLGLIWYSRPLFGNQWVELTKQEMKPARKWIPAGIIGHQLIALVLGIVVYLANATTVLEGIAVGVLLWIGFIVTLEVGEVIWEKVPVKLIAIRIAYHFVAMSMAGALLAVWR